LALVEDQDESTIEMSKTKPWSRRVEMNWRSSRLGPC